MYVDGYAERDRFGTEAIVVEEILGSIDPIRNAQESLAHQAGGIALQGVQVELSLGNAVFLQQFQQPPFSQAACCYLRHQITLAFLRGTDVSEQ